LRIHVQRAVCQAFEANGGHGAEGAAD
jgi:hypothetical protein